MEQNDGIILKGVRVHNLKNINLNIPYEKLVVITGLSGSGKSSLAFDTLFAEGQRRYVESLSAYARQFLGKMNKPDVDLIDGIPPAIAIRQKVNTRNPRSTVGTSTEVYDYIKLLFSRIGRTYSPITGKEVKKHTIQDVVDYILNFSQDTKIVIAFPYTFNSVQKKSDQLELIENQSYNRVFHNNKIYKIDEAKSIIDNDNSEQIYIVLDRLKVDKDKNQIGRLSESVQTAFFEGKGKCCIIEIASNKYLSKIFTDSFEADGIQFETPNEHLFSFNNPIGACPVCEGFGKVLGIDEDLVVPNKSLSLYDDAIACWRGQKMQQWKFEFIDKTAQYNFPIHRPYYALSDSEKDLLWKGNNKVSGINDFFKYLESKKQKIQYRVMISRYRGKTTCYECNGRRLRKEANYVKINNKSIADLIEMSISKLKYFFDNLVLSENEQKIADRLLSDISMRLEALTDVGLGYLTLNRLSSTLSGGESQRVNLATILGSGLVGSLYVLDEPSIGLHPKDTGNLINVLKKLRDRGNTVVVVEHDEDIIRAADYIIDIGPKAGKLGGEVVYEGDLDNMLKNSNTLTAQYLKSELKTFDNYTRNKSTNYIEIKGARQYNLKNIDVKIPLGIITLITGVSGSGKTTLIKSILYPSVKKMLGLYADKTGEHDAISGDIHLIKDIEYVDQNPIGKSSRSNPATYIKVYDEIRKLFASQKHAKANAYKPSHFSFNVSGGRCETCQGEGEITVEMQFMADVHLLCEECGGKRFKDDILDVKYRGKNIFDILEMPINEAVEFFGKEKGKYETKITKLLQNYIDVGMGYVKLGQSSNTLSGGESQRIKLASYLSKEQMEPMIFIFDEPTTGLHFHDITKLLQSFDKMRAKGHTLIIIEHNPEVIKFADHIIDLGPGGGENGGQIMFQGTPDDIIKEH